MLTCATGGGKQHDGDGRDPELDMTGSLNRLPSLFLLAENSDYLRK